MFFNMNLSEKSFHLIVFFTYGNSLKTWADTGLIGRELLLYKRMVKDGNRVSLVTYGGKEDYQYSDQLDGINVVPVYDYVEKSEHRWINLIKSVFIPFSFRFKKLFISGDIFKTNQMGAGWVPIIAGIVFRRPLVVRCGFEMLRNLLRDEKRKSIWFIKAIFGYAFEFIAYAVADKIIISNNSDINYVKKFFSVKKDKIELIRNFIDTKHFSPNNSDSIKINNRN